MAEVSVKQPPATEVMAVGNRALNSGLLDGNESNSVKQGMRTLGDRWNTLNIEVIEKEMR